MNKSLLNIFYLTILLVCFSLTANANEPNIKLVVTANHPDWVFKLNENVTFSISVEKDAKLLNNVKVDYEIGPERMPSTIKKSVVLTDGKIEIDGGTMTLPGFLRCNVNLEYENSKYVGLATAAFEPEKIQPTTTLPKDFTQFWTNAKAENSKIPLDSKLTLLPQRCTEKANVYEVSIQNFKIGMRVYGILSVPKAPGNYPAVLQVPGAGARPYKGNVQMAENGIINLQIGIHGIPVTLDSIVYANLQYGALDGYPTFNLDLRDEYYYKHVYLGCVRAVDFIYSLPQFDGKTLAVMGGSQGGALSIVTAALDDRVKCLSCFYPALCDITGYLHGRAGGWPHVFINPKYATTEKIETSKYYDVVNFAKQLKVPGFYSFGFNDKTCPPTSIYSAYNSITAPKTLFIVKETGHNTVPEQYTKSNEFIFKLIREK